MYLVERHETWAWCLHFMNHINKRIRKVIIYYYLILFCYNTSHFWCSSWSPAPVTILWFLECPYRMVSILYSSCAGNIYQLLLKSGASEFPQLIPLHSVHTSLQRRPWLQPQHMKFSSSTGAGDLSVCFKNR